MSSYRRVLLCAFIVLANACGREEPQQDAIIEPPPAVPEQIDSAARELLDRQQAIIDETRALQAELVRQLDEIRKELEASNRQLRKSNRKQLEIEARLQQRQN